MSADPIYSAAAAEAPGEVAEPGEGEGGGEPPPPSSWVGRLVVVGEHAPKDPPCEEELQQRPGAGAIDAAGARGQVIQWLGECDKYLVQTFDGEYMRLEECYLSEIRSAASWGPALGAATGDASIDDGSFDAAFPVSPYGEDTFVRELFDALREKGYGVVQMTSRVSDRRGALYSSEDSADWERPIFEFEGAFMGRRPTGKKMLWLKDISDDIESVEDDHLGAVDYLLTDLATLLLPETPILGFLGSNRTNGMLHAGCLPEEEAQLIQSQQSRASVPARDLLNHLAFCARRKVCMMFFVGGNGGQLSLHPRGVEDSDDNSPRVLQIRCNENQAIVFRHDLYDYTFEPAPKQLALQAWLLRERLEGEEGMDQDQPSSTLDLCDRSGRALPRPPVYRDSSESVDVTALACRNPGSIWSPEDYWALLVSTTDACVTVPLARWDHDLYWSDDPEPGKGYVRHFGFLDTEQLTGFDHDFFGMKLEEAECVDPVQRVGLEVAYESLFRGGWSKRTLRGSEIVACYAYASGEWSGGARLGRFGPGPSSDIYTQNTPASAASRLHYLFGVSGPCTTVETACSSSLTATAMMHSQMRPPRSDALKASMRKQVRYGMAVGMHSYFEPFYTIGLCANSMLTHLGRCFTFDGSADGYVRGEGYTALHYRVSDGEDLTRLAMLCGTCMNQDGRSASLTAPHGPSQQECIRHSLREANIRALDIQIQELHGTGTPLGDPIEVGALRATMMASEGEVRSHPLIKTSAKSNIGHTELNAGNCGIMKCVLMGIYCTASGNAHLRLLNPHIDVTGYPVSFAGETVDQGKSDGFHGVSSFGFGGSNARGDIWARAQAGARNTQPNGMLLDLSRSRIEGLALCYGLSHALPGSAGDGSGRHRSSEAGRPRGTLAWSSSTGSGAWAASAAVPESADAPSSAGFSGNYLTGGFGAEGAQAMALRAHGSFDGWGSGVLMDFDEDLHIFSFAIRLGETLIEHFRINCAGLGDIFPACERASMDDLVLGPGKAPPHNSWVIDGRADQATEGTVYRITFKWDSLNGQKELRWMPSMDPRSLALAAAKTFKHRYFTLASWNSWLPIAMRRIPGEHGAFEVATRIGLAGFEEFVFQRDCDSSQEIYPAQSCAALGEASVAVHGPDHRCGKRRWRVTGETGDTVVLRLRVAGGAVEVEVSGPCAQRIFRSVAGASRLYSLWDGVNFKAMTPSQSHIALHSAMVRVGADGFLQFQIVVNEDVEMAIYPEMHLADQGLSFALGPDARGRGMCWGVEAVPGSEVEVVLDLARSDRRQVVSWKVVGPVGSALADQ